jgi:hypothetical protein
MAAITAAVIGGTAISALSAGTIAAGVSGLTAAAGATMSFAQAGEAKAKAADATRAADKALAEAKSKLDLNFYDALGIQKEPYELQREALLASGAQAIEAGRESERGAAATAGRVQMAQNEAQAGVRTAMGQDLMALEKLSAAEDSRLRDVGAQINLEEVAGAQLASANFQSMAGRATTQGMEGLVGAGKAFATSLPLYMKDVDVAKKIAEEAAAKAKLPQANNVVVAQAATPTGATTAGVADLAPMATTNPVTQAATTPVADNTTPAPGTPAPSPSTPATEGSSLTFYDPNLDISPFNFPNRATTAAEKQKIFEGNYKLDPVTKKYVPLWDF